MDSHPWYTYLLRCSDGSLYTGVTTDLERRVREHNRGRASRYTAGRRPVWLVGAWKFPDRASAQRAEARLRRLPRLEKERMAITGTPFDGAPFCGPLPPRFCPRCGAPLEVTFRPGADRPLQVCSACGRTHYRNAKPCVGVLAMRDGRLLLVRRAIDPFRGYWDIPGGFLEEGEHPEQGALREVKEETGLEVHLTDLLGFYLDRYVYQGEQGITLNIYFLGEVIGGEERPADDAAALGWFPPDRLPRRLAFDHARKVLEDWRRRIVGGSI